VVENPTTPMEIRLELLKQLAGDEMGRMRMTAAKNPSTPVSILENLAGDEDEDVRRGAAYNPNTPVSILKQLAGDEGGWVRRSVANNPNTPMELRLELHKQLAGDENVEVRKSVARDPSIPASILEKLAGDEESGVRETVAIGAEHDGPTTNPNTPVSVLMKLVGDKSDSVRYRVAGNPNTPDEALILLASDKKALVHNPARERLRDLPPARQSRLKELATPLLQECVKGSQPSLPRLITLLHSQCPVPALAKHFRSSDWRERCAIAQNPSTPPNTLALLASEGNRVVRAAARENLKTQGEA